MRQKNGTLLLHCEVTNGTNQTQVKDDVNGFSGSISEAIVGNISTESMSVRISISMVKL